MAHLGCLPKQGSLICGFKKNGWACRHDILDPGFYECCTKSCAVVCKLNPEVLRRFLCLTLV